jgi:hypothetical protein
MYLNEPLSRFDGGGKNVLLSYDKYFGKAKES